ncbi:leucine-rich repeat protein [Prevotella sp.]|uniref:leucine-rich repeat domain-containing protein n=1 Tax=Prevotella sp. TaxID=59823 RepID=UPI003F7FD1AA
MDTNKIKKFATEARNILKAGIAARLTALGFDHKGQVPENNLKCATKPFNVLLACTHPLITDNVESNCSTTRNYSSESSEFLRFNMYFCHVYLKKIVMKQIIKRGSFFTLMFMLLGCLSLYAADNDLITEQITIELEKAGTLPGRIGGSKKYKITNLKIIGEINGTDLNMIREMAVRNSKGDSTYGKLSVLDLSEAKIVEGGDCYYYDYSNHSYYTSDECYTSNDVIGRYAFSGCSGLTSLTLPAGITEIGEYAFCDCDGLTSLTLPAGITWISYGAFRGCSGLTSLTLPAGITEISSEAFRGCSGLTSLTLPAGITEIYNGTFYGCSGLTSLTLPAGITEIDSEAFYGCSGLTSVYVYAEKVPKIYSDVFLGVDAKKCTLYVPMGTRDDYRFSGFGYYFENIVEFDATGIDKTTTSTDVEEVGRYSVNGQRLSAPTKGLNIVKYSDGSVKKVAVR